MTKAATWITTTFYLLRACDLDEGYACNSTAQFFKNGIFVARDLDAARVYYEKTCALGIAEGCASVNSVNVLQASEEAEAERLRLAAVAIADTDNDGMPDVWESANAFDPNDPSDAVEDWDGDGVSNRDEFADGTDARDVEPETTDTEGGGPGTGGGGSVGLWMLLLMSLGMLMGKGRIFQARCTRF